MVEYWSVTSDMGITVHFAVPSEPLRPYLTAYCLAAATHARAAAAGQPLQVLHPPSGAP